MQANVGVRALKIPSHAIHTYRWSAQPGGPRLVRTNRAASGHDPNSSSPVQAGESVGPPTFPSVANSSHLQSSRTVPRAAQAVGASVDVRRPRSTARPLAGEEAMASVAREERRSSHWFILFEWRLSLFVWPESARGAKIVDASSRARTRLPPVFYALLALTAAIAGLSISRRNFRRKGSGGAASGRAHTPHIVGGGALL